MPRRTTGSIRCALLAAALPFWAGPNLSPSPAQSIDFSEQVAPLLVSSCLPCHQGVEPKGGLDLTASASATQGGDSGKALVAGRPDDSLMWKKIQSDQMPPEHPLGQADKAILRQWIEEGAHWSRDPLDPFSVTTSSRAGRDWWGLQPLRTVSPPPPPPADDWGRNAIDAFVYRRLQAKGLKPSAPANPRSLIRRVYFDLIGLPPDPEQVAAFVNDPSEAAYQRIVNQLLSSEHYGERWGRHWLDVVRFGESDGFERNAERKNAWHYRDWVIDALNRDMPYNQFVQMQLIGDQIVGGISGAAATGFWVAGVHNTTVGGSPRMKQLARQDEIEEVLATLGQSFLGLTVHCARCHDHKFDPVYQTEYYQLASAVSGLGHGERTIALPEAEAEIRNLDRQIADLRKEQSTIDQIAHEKVMASRAADDHAAAPEPLAARARWEFETDLNDTTGKLQGTPHGNAHLQDGALRLDGKSFVATGPITTPFAEKTLEAWIQLDSREQRGGAALSLETRDGTVFDAIVFGERQARHWMPGSNGFVRTDSFEGAEENEATERPVHIALVYQQDGTIIGYRDGRPYGHAIRKSPLHRFAPENTEILFGLRHRPAGGDRFLTGKIYRAAIYDRALSSQEVAYSAGIATNSVSEVQRIAALDPSMRQRRATVTERITELSAKRDQLAGSAHQKVYTLVAGSGNTTRVLLRGDPDKPGSVVSPAATAAITGLSADFDLAPDAPEDERRRKLSEWITHENNPLFSRVMVNRIWHYHFGTGIVDTPNDFGFNGGRPSHPDLLDYLAHQFQQNDYRMKWLHRQIVSSSTYRQAVHGKPPSDWYRAASKDAGNRLLWRGATRRLEAEALRDSILDVSGALNKKRGGPGFQDVSITPNNGTTYYAPIDIDGPVFFRRTVYRFNPRGGRSALLDTFDCPDPALPAPRRSVTSTPLQSLSLMNNRLVVRMAGDFAQRVREEAGENVSDQINRAWQLAIARDPSESERLLSRQLVTEHGLPALCRGLFNVNEFVFIE